MVRVWENIMQKYHVSLLSSFLSQGVLWLLLEPEYQTLEIFPKAFSWIYLDTQIGACCVNNPLTRRWISQATAGMLFLL